MPPFTDSTSKSWPKSVQFLIYKLPTIRITQLSLSEVVSSSLEPSYQARIAFGMKLLSISPSAFLSKACIKHRWINRSIQTFSHVPFQSRIISVILKKNDVFFQYSKKNRQKSIFSKFLKLSGDGSYRIWTGLGVLFRPPNRFIAPHVIFQKSRFFA